MTTSNVSVDEQLNYGYDLTRAQMDFDAEVA